MVAAYLRTPLCRPPELLLGAEEYNTEIDMWSVGCIFAELLVGKPIFPGKDEMDQLEKIQAIMGCPNEHNMPGLNKLQWCECFLCASSPLPPCCTSLHSVYVTLLVFCTEFQFPFRVL